MRSWILASPGMALTVGGFALGFAFGWLARATNYCLMGAVADWRLTGDATRLGGAAIAAAVAIIGAQALHWTGVVDLSRSMYLAPRINWVGAIGGGAIFGIGMVYAGGCPSRALVRAGGGDLRAGVTLLAMAVAAYATLSGVLGGARVAIDQTTAIDTASYGVSTQGLPDIFAATGLHIGASTLSAALAVSGALLTFAAVAIAAAGRARQIMAGFGVGAIVTLGWALTGMAADDMAAAPVSPASLSFVKPVADAVDWIERSTALGWPGFAAATVFGVVVGSFVSATIDRSVRFHGFADAGDLKRHLGGAVAMGAGGVLGLGCTIGQGVTGVSTLAAQSFLTVAAMLAGAAYGLARLQRDV